MRQIQFWSFVNGFSKQTLNWAMLGLPLKWYLNLVMFVLRLTWSKSMLGQHSKLLSGFKRFCVIDSLHINSFQLVEQMNQNNVDDNRKRPHDIKSSKYF